MRNAIGVFGSSRIVGGSIADLAGSVGGYIASEGGILVTGACTGIPHRAAQVAYDFSSHFGSTSRSLVLGISPFSSAQVHLAHSGMTTDHHDIIQYTGLGDDLPDGENYMARTPILLGTVAVGVVFPGTRGTIAELEAAVDKELPLLMISGLDTEFDGQALEILGRGSGKHVKHCLDLGQIQRALRRYL